MLHNRLAKLREERENGEHGFTLIELLVVVVIIGILIAIAIPLYLNYKRGANDKSAQSDLRNAVSVLEQCNANGSTGYPTAMTSAGVMTGCSGSGQINLSSGTQVYYAPATASSPTNYIMESKNTNGSGTIYCYSSSAGGQVTSTAATAFLTAYQATCPS